MLVLGHRGYHADVRENTLESFQRAIAMGVDGIETDVRLSADGILILYHDRCVGFGTHVSTLTHAELEKTVGYPVPTLESAIAEWRNVLWNLEIKSAATLELAATLLRKYKSTRNFLVTSFIHSVVCEIVQRADVEGGFLVAHSPLQLEFCRRQSDLDPRLTTIVWDCEICTGALIANSAANGFRNFVYGPITLEEHQQLAKWTVNGIITDYPQNLRIGERKDVDRK
jgi:glycerophosphoryl diester phosphodiesterase